MTAYRITAFGNPDLENKVIRKKKVTAASGGPYTSGMIALIPTAEDANRIAFDGGLPAHELHTTLLFLGEADDWTQELRSSVVEGAWDAAEETGPITAEAFSLNMFNPGSEHACWVIGIGGRELSDARVHINEGVYNKLEADPDIIPEQHIPWVPHLTVTYTNDLTVADQIAQRLGPITYDRIRIAFAETEVYDIVL